MNPDEQLVAALERLADELAAHREAIQRPPARERGLFWPFMLLLIVLLITFDLWDQSRKKTDPVETDPVETGSARRPGGAS